jgi:cytochrome c peroxidase
VLGALSNAPGPGLRCGTRPCTYPDLIAGAFGLEAVLDAEERFSSLWGQAIQAYEATLVPDHTPYDRYLAGDAAALGPNQLAGLAVFRGKGGCAACHAEPELTDASVRFGSENGLVNGDGGDQGFHNIGVRPTAEDLGRAGSGPDGRPLSVSGAPADRGAFKTPALRNAALTAPYFHDGSVPTLDLVIDFYENGGFYANAEKSRFVQPIAFTREEKAALVEFLQIALTDCRVQYGAAPFDHPSLDIPDGPSLPAVGAQGIGRGLCP